MNFLSTREEYAATTAKLKLLHSPLRRTYMSLSVLVILVTLGFLVAIWTYRISGRDSFKRESISAYYYAADTFVFRMRDVFVASLSMAAILLLAYQGYTRWENWLLNCAGIFLLAVVSCPMDPPLNPSPPPNEEPPLTWRAQVHYTSALLFFLCLVIICLFSARNASQVLPPDVRKRFQMWYGLTALLMVVFPIVAISLYFANYKYDVYVSECSGVLIFCGYWIIKLVELIQIWRDAESGGGSSRDEGD